jgi:hypothetical protein
MGTKELGGGWSSYCASIYTEGVARLVTFLRSAILGNGVFGRITRKINFIFGILWIFSVARFVARSGSAWNDVGPHGYGAYHFVMMERHWAILPPTRASAALCGGGGRVRCVGLL